MTADRRDELQELLRPYARRVEDDLARWLVEPDTPAELAEAMRYCALDGGKRLRPALVLMTAEAVGGKLASAPPCRAAAAAVEMIHCYSLVHDDLPAMDDDRLRRGRPTAHVAFGEAMAILVGDALLTRAFGVLAEHGGAKAATLAGELARACGPAGTIAGQVADMGLCAVPAGSEGLRFIHLRKTAALIRAAARMGAVCAGADAEALQAVSRYAELLGLAFQLTDDLLDVVGVEADLGKTAGKDADAGKRTYAAEMGLAKALAVGKELTQGAIDALTAVRLRSEKLCELAQRLVDRTH